MSSSKETDLISVTTPVMPDASIKARSIAELAVALRGEVIGCADLEIAGVNGIDMATDDEITFIVDEARARAFVAGDAGAAVLSRRVAVPDFDQVTRALIVVDDAELALIELLDLFAPPCRQHQPGVHPSAVVSSSATIGPGASIGPHVSIEDDSIIGRNVVLHPGVRIGRGVTIGDDSELFHNVVIRDHCTIGECVVLHNGVSIGADGFGYRPAPDGSGLVKMPHIGTVEIHDHVEIGANSTVDRGKFGATIIGAGTKVDNLVQIGHNCVIGRCCIIVAMAAVGGSVTTGDGVQIGGSTAIRDHTHLGAGSRISGGSGVIGDVPEGATVFGFPAQNHVDELRDIATVRKLRAWMKQVEARLEGPKL